MARGIAGSEFPGTAGVFLSASEDEAKWFVQIGRMHAGRAIDVWEVSLDLELEPGLDLGDDMSEKLPSDGPLVQHEDGFLCYLQPMPPERLRLIDPEALRDE